MYGFCSAIFLNVISDLHSDSAKIHTQYAALVAGCQYQTFPLHPLVQWLLQCQPSPHIHTHTHTHSALVRWVTVPTPKHSPVTRYWCPGQWSCQLSYTTSSQSPVNALVSFEVVQIVKLLIITSKVWLLALSIHFWGAVKCKNTINYRLLIIYKCLKMSNLLYLYKKNKLVQCHVRISVRLDCWDCILRK